ncbi:glycogen synthase GlgA [Tropicibacter oceani]|uniref:Glycogen synthase n=1 Tax=Tropicibacter oceani TaxID=3058420 RepID=A0ABY8QMQ2_9RHOB|nr:glycogen synthase GlgA [Tropicibacter oceani]WGW05924.1 glycogen synthase GlgA [Tropicibacter oceani]
MTRILSVASECAPLIKTGGLADVVGALPAALTALGDEVKTLVPGYPAVMEKLGKTKEVAVFDDLFGGSAGLLSTKSAGLDLLVLDAPHLFDRVGGPYLGPDGKDWPDNPERFAALSWVAAHVAVQGAGGWVPQVVHGHDWQAGFTPEYLHGMGCDVPFVFTIHNVAFHGNAPADRLGSLRLDPWRFTPGHFEFWGQISALKAGLMGAQRITTVSQTYAEELLTAEFGIGMDGILRDRQAVLNGIVNGIDTDVWNPETDPEITPYKAPKGKQANKDALRAEFGLPEADGPLCVLVSRLTQQKGIDLLIDAIDALLERGGQLALLGSGDPALEAAVQHLATRHPNVAVRIGYDEGLSHRMMAGADAILVPSRFEPCGLTQLYGLRYGTVPLVALTGGLADTVINASPAALARGVATGIQFFPITGRALANAFGRLCDLYDTPKVWTAMQRNAMKQPVGWETSAAAYHALYDAVTEG